MPSDIMLRITKKYIIDLLNSMCFSNTICWGGIDQYNEMPLFNDDTDNDVEREQRGSLLVHNRMSTALRLLVTAEINSTTRSNKVCYRLLNLNKNVEIPNPKRLLMPARYNVVDFSVADINLGLDIDSAYSFSYSISKNDDEERVAVVELLRFILNSSFYALDDSSLFDDILLDEVSSIPYPGCEHFNPVFKVTY